MFNKIVHENRCHARVVSESKNDPLNARENFLRKLETNFEHMRSAVVRRDFYLISQKPKAVGKGEDHMRPQQASFRAHACSQPASPPPFSRSQIQHKPRRQNRGLPNAARAVTSVVTLKPTN